MDVMKHEISNNELEEKTSEYTVAVDPAATVK